jgi:hypothetical protein
MNQRYYTHFFQNENKFIVGKTYETIRVQRCPYTNYANNMHIWSVLNSNDASLLNSMVTQTYFLSTIDKTKLYKLHDNSSNMIVIRDFVTINYNDNDNSSNLIKNSGQ